MSDTATDTSTDTTTDATATDATTDTGAADTSTDTSTTATDDAATEDARVKRANAQAAQYRTQLRAQEAEVAGLKDTLGKLAAVFNPGAAEGETPDPAALTGQVEQLTTEAAQLKAELLVHTIAGTNGGNPNALLDSRNFTKALHGLDPAAADYPDLVAAAIKDAVSKNATLATAGQGPSRGGAPGAGTGSEQPAGSVTQEQFNAMDYKARTALYATNPDLYRRLAVAGT